MCLGRRVTCRARVQRAGLGRTGRSWFREESEKREEGCRRVDLATVTASGFFKKQLPDDPQKSLLALPFLGSRTSEGEHLIDQRLNPHATAAWCLHYLERKKCMGRKKTDPTHLTPLVQRLRGKEAGAYPRGLVGPGTTFWDGF